MRTRKFLLLVMICIGIGSFVIACGHENTETSSEPLNQNPVTVPATTSENNNTSPPPAKPEPVELTFYYVGAYGEEVFTRNYGRFISAKYPHITLKFIENVEGTRLPEVLAQNIPIDIIYMTLAAVPQNLVDTGLQYDMSELAKKYNYDVSQIEQPILEMVRNVANANMIALPVGMDGGKFVYNKDLFAMFGQDVPKDGLTWDDVYALARTMTRKEGDIQYQGIILNFDHLTMRNQMGAGFVDPQTDKSTLNDHKWNRVISNLVRFYEIPGNELSGFPINLFIKDLTAAMMATFNSLNPAWEGDWDIARFPTMPEYPDAGPLTNPNAFAVTSISKHKDEAFQMLAYLTSEEYQIAMAREGIVLPVLQAQDVKEAYGKDVEFLQGKNIMALYPQQYAPGYDMTIYDTAARGQLTQQINRVLAKEIDINTALREAAELADQAIEALKSQK